MAQVNSLNKQIADQQGENERLLERNRILEAEVLEPSRHGDRRGARPSELGMVKEGETSTSL